MSVNFSLLCFSSSLYCTCSLFLMSHFSFPIYQLHLSISHFWTEHTHTRPKWVRKKCKINYFLFFEKFDPNTRENDGMIGLGGLWVWKFDARRSNQFTYYLRIKCFSKYKTLWTQKDRKSKEYLKYILVRTNVLCIEDFFSLANIRLSHELKSDLTLKLLIILNYLLLIIFYSKKLTVTH